MEKCLVTACNSYHTLKQQNEELTAQLEKERKDKEGLIKLGQIINNL